LKTHPAQWIEFQINASKNEDPTAQWMGFYDQYFKAHGLRSMGHLKATRSFIRLG